MSKPLYADVKFVKCLGCDRKIEDPKKFCSETCREVYRLRITRVERTRENTKPR